jgi:hypothetical protein
MSLSTHFISIVQAKLSEQLCCIENGFFFANDEAIFLSGNPRSGYVPSAHLSIHTMLAQSTAAWTELDENPNCRLEKKGLVLWGGSTSCWGYNATNKVINMVPVGRQGLFNPNQ